MDLILWRHADAEDAIPDLTRNLTTKGDRQAKRMAGWLRVHLPKQARILSSPANRSRQTADALHAVDVFGRMQDIEHLRPLRRPEGERRTSRLAHRVQRGARPPR
jgi:phosphohistidine phosphatase SixA